MSMIKKEPDLPSVVVVGGGAAGMMAAVTAARNGVSTLLLEKNDRLGKKLRITGKGRCNLTNDCELNEFLANVPTNPRFLYGALSGFSTGDTKQFFEDLGVPLKTERGKRVFPVSDRAGDVVAALESACRASGVRILHEKVTGIPVADGVVIGVRTSAGIHRADAVILCTGGKSYPTTGSDGDGYRFAQAMGHTVTPLSPSLIPLTSPGGLCASMQGLSLRNVALRVCNIASGKCVYDDFGELLFTHFGLSGPMVLSASAHLADIAPGKYEAKIDLKPALDEKKMDTRLLSDFAAFRNRELGNSLHELLPQKMILPFLKLCGLDPHKRVHSVTREEREGMVRMLKGFPVPLSGVRPIAEAIITRGGVSIKEVSPKTMESKLIGGMYFAGEILDVDAYTGGFNLQIAFSTAVAAGRAAVARVADTESK